MEVFQGGGAARRREDTTKGGDRGGRSNQCMDAPFGEGADGLHRWISEEAEANAPS
jgi:hypothetical protein